MANTGIIELSEYYQCIVVCPCSVVQLTAALVTDAHTESGTGVLQT